MNTKVVLGGILAILVLLFGATWLSNLSPRSEGVLSRNGLHWHPELEIYIKGEKQEIPESIGLLGAHHNPIHTHDDMPIVHLEFNSRVTEDDVRLGRFFEVWGKEFSRDQIFEHHNGPEGMVHMYVNGIENTEFENYMMRDGDKIEIRYE